MKTKPDPIKTITIEEAYALLEQCSAVVTEEHALMYPTLSQLTDDKENEFLYLQWEDEGQEYNLKFAEKDNEKVKVTGSSMFLIDTEGDERQLTLLDLMELT